MGLGSIATTKKVRLPLPLAGEGWGGGVSAGDTARMERAPTRRFAPTSPASGRGKNASIRLHIFLRDDRICPKSLVDKAMLLQPCDLVADVLDVELAVGIDIGAI